MTSAPGRTARRSHATFPLLLREAILPIGLILLPVLLLMGGCSSNGPTGPAAPTAPALDLGPAVPMASETIGAGGGTLTVDAPGDSLDGLTIDVPDGAYTGARAYEVEARRITGIRNGREAFKPLTPLITIRNGGGFATAPMLLTIPCTVPEGDFPMAFLYDRATGRMEGMPLVWYDAGSVTVHTGNFEFSTAMAGGKTNTGAAADAESGIVVTSIPERLLESYREVASTFKPGVDDWQFVNWGSYASPDGQCAGQTLGALWYFMQRKSRGDARLNGRFDNDGAGEPTPKVWQDDVNPYRFCSLLQSQYWETFAARYFGNLQYLLPDRLTYNAIKYAMILTGEPVYITAGGTIKGEFTRHALTVYRIADGTVYIADPNDPGDLERTISFSGSFSPYKFGSKGANYPGIPFPRIEYIAKSSVIDYTLIRNYYQQMLEGSVGAELFPRYTIEAKNDGGYFVELSDGFRIGKRFITLRISSPSPLFTPGFEAYREDGTQYTTVGDEISLPVGRHRIGIYVFDKNKGYVGFNWYNVEIWETPPPHEPKTSGPCSCTLSFDGASVTTASASFHYGNYEDPFTHTLKKRLDIDYVYTGGYFNSSALEFTGTGIYPLYGNVAVADTNGYPDNDRHWTSYDNDAKLTVTGWDDWHLTGTINFSFGDEQIGEKRNVVGSFSCGR